VRFLEEEVVIAGAGAKCFYTNRRAAKKCSSKVGVRFCPSPCAHKVQVKYAIPVTDWTLDFGVFAFLSFSLGPAGDCPCRHYVRGESWLP
jgi:hypothetical protein